MHNNLTDIIYQAAVWRAACVVSLECILRGEHITIIYRVANLDIQ